MKTTQAGRRLTDDELAILLANGCQAEDWNRIRVADAFDAHALSQVHFSGDVQVGRTGTPVLLDGGLTVRSGIRHARIHDCRIGDDVLVEHVRQAIVRYDLGDGCRIQDVSALIMDGVGRFGNGTEVSVLDETGGKSVLIYAGMSAQTAAMMATNARRPSLVKALKTLVEHHADQHRSDRGRIGRKAVVRASGTLRNVRLEDGCIVDGAALLEDGTLCSAPDRDGGRTAAFVGASVVARHFILAPGAMVKDGAQLERCFVGEAAELSKGFSAHDSLFFANCAMENGEACATFAGPYTVSMHKSTLMVGGMFSFCNLGSGTNQSNHFYKLGPMHSGLCERGCKTGSDAYVLWPGRIGAFTFIKGRHTGNPDTTDFPFSYLLEEDGTSYLSPGAAVRSVGTLRDEIKWPARDKRRSVRPLDQLCFESLNPLTVASIHQGLRRMDAWAALPDATEYALTGAVLRKPAALKGRKLYQTALDVYYGTAVLDRIDAVSSGRIPAFLPSTVEDAGGWSDLSGLLVPQNELERLSKTLEDGSLNHIETLESTWETCRSMYSKWAWASVLNDLSSQWGKPVSQLTPKDFLPLVDHWEMAQASLYKQMQTDADLEMTMMHRFDGGEIPTHAFLATLQGLLADVPVRARKARTFLRN